MNDEVRARVLASSRYRDVDPALVARVVAEELPRARGADDAVKRVKRRLHQAIGAYRSRGDSRTRDDIREAWSGDWTDALRAASRAALARHASTRERLAGIDRFYESLWAAIGAVPGSVMDLACGLNPLALPFMGLERDARYLACDSDRRVLDEVEWFLTTVEQPHRTWACDLVADVPDAEADVALLLKTVPILDRQDPDAANRLVAALRAPWVVASFPARSLGGRASLASTYRARALSLVSALGDGYTAAAELAVANELLYVIRTPHADRRS
jgi:16S rRNA (guanine(1405)-N(7))-methyltransferase